MKDTGGVMDLLKTKWSGAVAVAGIFIKVAGMVYDALGRISQETQFWGDKWELVLKHTARNGAVTEYTYDAVNRVICKKATLAEENDEYYFFRC